MRYEISRVLYQIKLCEAFADFLWHRTEEYAGRAVGKGNKVLSNIGAAKPYRFMAQNRKCASVAVAHDDDAANLGGGQVGFQVG